jgi:hypothetical protein
VAGRGKWQGWAIGLGTQPIWATYAIITKGYGLLLTCAMFTTVYTKNLIKWRRDETLVKALEAGVNSGFITANEARGMGKAGLSFPAKSERVTKVTNVIRNKTDNRQFGHDEF